MIIWTVLAFVQTLSSSHVFQTPGLITSITEFVHPEDYRPAVSRILAQRENFPFKAYLAKVVIQRNPFWTVRYGCFFWDTPTERKKELFHAITQMNFREGFRDFTTSDTSIYEFIVTRGVTNVDNQN